MGNSKLPKSKEEHKHAKPQKIKLEIGEVSNGTFTAFVAPLSIF